MGLLYSLLPNTPLHLRIYCYIPVIFAMGMIFGKIDVECAAHDVMPYSFPTADVSLRRLQSHVLAKVSPNQVEENDMFRILARYIGVFGNPENKDSNKIAMTAPVLSSCKEDANDMRFVLPKKFKTKEDAPQPTDTRVELIDVPERMVAVKTFSGLISMDQSETMANEFKAALEAQGFICKDWMLARYNPPFTLWFLRTNEIWMTVDKDSIPTNEAEGTENSNL